MKCVIFLLGCTPMGAQSLQIPPAPPAGNRVGSFQLMIVSPETNRPAALQWRLLVPEGVTIVTRDIKAGSAAEVANKAITCAMSNDEKEGASGCVCILFGGVRPIPNGTIAVVRFTVAGGKRAVPIRVTNVLGATADAEPIPFADVQATMAARDVPRVK